MWSFNYTAVAILAEISLIAAQTTTSLYNNTQIKIQSSNQYNGSSLIGYHVGAGQSYIVGGASSGSSFSFNFSATRAQLLDNDIAAGYQLPCYVINSSQISNNSGPLECGVSDQNGYYDIASVGMPSDPAPGAITFNQIVQWYVCSAQSFTYGWVQGTVVGSWGRSVPSGPGIRNCSVITNIAFASTGGSLSSSRTTTTGASNKTSTVTTFTRNSTFLTSTTTTFSASTTGTNGTVSTLPSTSTSTSVSGSQSLPTVGPATINRTSTVYPLSAPTSSLSSTTLTSQPPTTSASDIPYSPSASAQFPVTSVTDSGASASSSPLTQNPTLILSTSTSSPTTSTSSPTTAITGFESQDPSASTTSSMSPAMSTMIVSYTGTRTFTPVATYLGTASSMKASLLALLISTFSTLFMLTN